VAEENPPVGDETSQAAPLISRPLALLLGQASTITALLFYFGYIRERAFWEYFGVDLGTVGFSPTDYVLRSPATIFAPLALLLGVALVALLGHHGFGVWAAHARRGSVRRAAVVMVIVAALLLVLGLASFTTLLSAALPPLVGPVSLGLGAGLFEYGLGMAIVSHVWAIAARRSLSSPRTRLARHLILGALGLAAVFDATAQLARLQGAQAAHVVAKTLPVQTKVVIYSKQRLQLTGRGVTGTDLNGHSAAYVFRYDGLRLLLHLNDRWLLVPYGWTHTNGEPVIILHDSPTEMRVELAPGR
jgi:hypothetical protein